ncbi:4-hydroxybenzoate 3-monooxygenase [Lentzea flava]|uniref:4-hydroxybenzoate 3-monooxygenase n=1 Tax=Lentzea flava TaxID=103732 RepID=A0ABQ2UL66_9PSEU|nr:4-hydroxybenzoate 3-monooxygenase [Lentzea flava]MCP2200529.1 p-hydroxybenzoate 3-monooxygenase [Lentzea flava]GGU43264.1 4-hydroxybenzoate 3-monooxygenase [Lentzea flava]
MNTTVAIVGAGPAGLVLANILNQAGVSTVVFERASREYVEQRARAGLIEYRAFQTLREHGLADGLMASATVHRSCEFRFAGERFVLDYGQFTGDRVHHVYPQQFLVRDLITRLLDNGGDIRFETPVTEISDLTGDYAVVSYSGTDNKIRTLRAEFVAGCDGSRGVCRRAVPTAGLRGVTKHYPTNLLAILSATSPLTRDMVYALHPDGCAIHALRTRDTSRFYLQVDAQDELADWDDERIWSELARRFAVADGSLPSPGPILETSMLSMRTSVTEELRHGRMLLVGDAAHVITPFGGKGMNLAIADADGLARAILAAVRDGDDHGLNSYSAAVNQRTWAAQEFSHSMIDLLCAHSNGDRDFQYRVQVARLAKWRQSPADARGFARDYVG